MDEMIREVLDYVAPRKVAEDVVVDAGKAKGKAAPKKGEAEAPIDVFEGKNT